MHSYLHHRHLNLLCQLPLGQCHTLYLPGERVLVAPVWPPAGQGDDHGDQVVDANIQQRVDTIMPSDVQTRRDTATIPLCNIFHHDSPHTPVTPPYTRRRRRRHTPLITLSFFLPYLA